MGTTKVRELADRVRTDPSFRTKLASRMKDVLVEMGADPDELDAIELGKGLPDDAPSMQLVFISTRDSKRNAKSIIIF